MDWEATEPILDEFYDAACQAEYDRISNERSMNYEGNTHVYDPIFVCPAAGG